MKTPNAKLSCLFEIFLNTCLLLVDSIMLHQSGLCTYVNCVSSSVLTVLPRGSLSFKSENVQVAGTVIKSNGRKNVM